MGYWSSSKWIQTLWAHLAHLAPPHLSFDRDKAAGITLEFDYYQINGGKCYEEYPHIKCISTVHYAET